MYFTTGWNLSIPSMCIIVVHIKPLPLLFSPLFHQLQNLIWHNYRAYSWNFLEQRDKVDGQKGVCHNYIFNIAYSANLLSFIVWWRVLRSRSSSLLTTRACRWLLSNLTMGTWYSHIKSWSTCTTIVIHSQFCNKIQTDEYLEMDIYLLIMYCSQEQTCVSRGGGVVSLI